MLKRLFFDPKKYDLGRVGRYKINQKLGINVDLGERILTDKDFIAAIKYLINLRRGEGTLDDIDHLGSRRVRTVGELLANQCRVGLARTERLVKERMTLFDINVDGMTPQKLINPKALSAVIRDFFGRSQLSQFMDQTNPLAELTHKRRLSALGPGGLSRERAGFAEVSVVCCGAVASDAPSAGSLLVSSVWASACGAVTANAVPTSSNVAARRLKSCDTAFRERFGACQVVGTRRKVPGRCTRSLSRVAGLRWPVITETE